MSERKEVRFDYVLHDEKSHEERIAEIAVSAGIVIDAELSGKIGRAFYEVILQCLLDTDTGEITILGAGT